MCSTARYIGWTGFLFVILSTGAQAQSESPSLFEALPFTEENRRFHRYTVNDGLAHRVVKTLLQDRKGFIWIGTENGLNRFDGHTFQTFHHNIQDTTSLSDDWILSLFEDQTGTLWVGTIKGLNRFDPATETFVRYHHAPSRPESISGNLIAAMLEDRAGAFWIATSQGLNMMDRTTGRFTRFLHNPTDPATLNGNDVVALLEDRSGALWVSTTRGLNRLDPVTHTFRRYPGATPRVVMNMAEDASGRLWLATSSSGLCAFNPATNTQCYRHAPRGRRNLATHQIEQVYIDQTGHIWAGTGAGLSRLNPDTEVFTWFFSDPDDPTSLNGELILALASDHTGALWIGTDSGLNRLDPEASRFQLMEPLRDVPVRALAEDGQSNLWIGTHSTLGLLRIGTNGTVKQLTHNPDRPNSLSTHKVWAVLPDSRGWVWINTDRGLNLYLPQTDQIYRAADILQNVPPIHPLQNSSELSGLAEDQNGHIWVTGWGIYRLRVEATAPHPIVVLDTTLNHGYHTNVKRAPDGRVWIASGGGGLIQVNPQTDTTVLYRHDLDDPHSLSNDLVFELFFDEAGTLWVGTKQGLNRFDAETQQFDRWLEQDGLVSDYIHAITSDGQGQLWISTDKGLTRFDPTQSAFYHFGVTDGTQPEYHVRNALRRRDGTLLFGGPQGVTWFHPEAGAEGSTVLPVQLTGFHKFNERVWFDQDISEVKTITLTHDENAISFDFLGLSYTHPKRIQYAYQMIGFDADWVHSGSRRTAYYTNLDPGRYTFRAKAANREGIWSEEELQVALVVRPPFWQTWWFKSLMLGSFLALAYFVYHVRIRRLEQTQRIQEQFSRQLIQTQENERERIARELHDSLGQNLLMLKNGVEHVMQSKNGADEDLALFSQIAQKSINEVRSISSNLHPHQIKSLGLTVAIESALNQLDEVLEMKVEGQIERVDGLLRNDAEVHVYRMIQEGVNNAVRHAEAQTIRVALHRRPTRLTLSISDDGKGFDPARVHENGRHGLGLTGISERAAMLGGTFTVESASGKGTTLKVHVPIKP